MTRFLTSLLSFLCITSVVLAQASKLEESLKEPIPEATDANAKKIIQAHLRARGGLQNILAIRNMELNGNFREGKQDWELHILRMAPDMYLEETSKSLLGRTSTSIEAYDGSMAWTYDSADKKKLPYAVKGKEAGKIKQEADFYGPFVNSEAKGYFFKYVGKKNSRGRSNYIIKLYNPAGYTKLVYFDAKNFMISRISWESVVKKSIVQLDTYITKYRKVNKVWMGEKLEMAIAKQAYGHLTFTSIKANTQLTANDFKMPRKKEVWLKR